MVPTIKDLSEVPDPTIMDLSGEMDLIITDLSGDMDLIIKDLSGDLDTTMDLLEDLDIILNSLINSKVILGFNKDLLLCTKDLDKVLLTITLVNNNKNKKNKKLINTVTNLEDSHLVPLLKKENANLRNGKNK